MTHIWSNEQQRSPEKGLTPTKAAWREGRLVAPRDVLEFFARVRTRRIEGRSGVRFELTPSIRAEHPPLRGGSGP
jgi:hypothetical protein